MVPDPFDPGHLLGTDRDCGLKQTTDGGLTWDEVDISLFIVESCDRLLIHFNSFQPSLVYLGVNERDGKARLLRSTDGGSNWEIVSRQLPGQIEALRSTSLSSRGEIRLIAKFDHAANRFMGIDWPFGNWAGD